MSYSVSVPIGKQEDFDATLDAAIDAYPWATTNPDGEAPVRTAARLVKAIVEERVIGKQGTDWLTCTISGHGNPERDNTGTGYVRDCMTITLQQQAAPADDTSNSE